MLRVGRRRGVRAAWLLTATLVAGCGSDPEPPPPTTTSSPAPPLTAKAPASLLAALLTAADVPAAKPAAAARKTDFSACFPGNPLGLQNNPNEVVGPHLALVQGKVERTYGSSATQVGPRQAAAYVATFASPEGSACMVKAIKAALGSGPGETTDASGLTGSVKTASIAEGGAVLTVKGNLKVDGATVPLTFDLVTFHAGPLMVLVSTSSLRGPAVSGQAVELGKRIAGRLP